MSHYNIELWQGFILSLLLQTNECLTDWNAQIVHQYILYNFLVTLKRRLDMGEDKGIYAKTWTCFGKSVPRLQTPDPTERPKRFSTITPLSRLQITHGCITKLDTCDCSTDVQIIHQDALIAIAIMLESTLQSNSASISNAEHGSI